MAVVWRGEDMMLRREVAVKLLHPHLARQEHLRARFLREARAAAGLDDAGILKIFDVGAGSDGEPPFIVMELLRGRSLKAFLDENGPPLAEMAALVGASLARTIQVAHDAGVIHRDIKPANVMVVEGGRLVVCDFGLARIDDDALATQTGETLGTPAFMSPEQALGRRVDARTDVYSLGATLYQLATGVLPFSGASAAVLQNVIHGLVDPPSRKNPAIGGELEALILHAMARAPDERYPTAAALADALTALVDPLEPADLAEYFAAPGAWNARTLPRVLESVCTRARAAASSGKKARALALADRVLALEPSNPEALALAAKLGVGTRRRKQATLVAAGAMFLVAGTFGVTMWNQKKPVPAAVPETVAVAETVAVPVAAPDAAAARSASASDAAVASAPVAAPPRATRPPRVRPPAEPQPQTQTQPPLQPQTQPQTQTQPQSATLTVRIRPWCDIEIDSLPHGRSPSATPIELPAGHHTVVCKQPGVGRAYTTELDLAAGEHRTLDETLYRAVAVKIGLASGGRATIDGRGVAAGATVSLEPGSHQVEAQSGDDHAGPAYIDIPTHACEIRLRPELACYETK